MSVLEALAQARKTNVTKTIHQKPYPTIDTSRPELNQSGKAILITGGGTGAGFAIAQAFIRASASTIIILGRRVDVLEKARTQLEDYAKNAGTNTVIIAKPCDIVNAAEVDTLWEELAAQNILVDVYVANAAKFTEPTPLMELGLQEVWSQVETNVKSPLHFVEKFYQQGKEKQKFIINLSTASIHAHSIPLVAARPAYTLSKLSGTLLFQLLAHDFANDNIQVISFHPGLLHNEYFESMGLGAEHFDDKELTGSFAVWAATKEAAFLNGRFVWCSWDVDELATGELRKRIDEDFYFLKTSVVGLNEGLLV